VLAFENKRNECPGQEGVIIILHYF